MAEKDESYWQQVEDYLRGRGPLPTHDQAAEDAALQQQLEDGIAHAGSRALKARLRRIHQEETRTGNAQVRTLRPRRRYWQLAAAVAILVVGILAVQLLLPAASVGADELYSAYYEPYTLDLTLRGEVTSSRVSRLEKMYNKGNFAGVLPLLAEEIDAGGSTPRLQLAKAIALWETGASEAAKAELQSLLTHPLLSDQARWYAALFELKTTNTSTACDYLQRISTSGGQWYAQGQDLARKLSCS